MKLYFTQSLGLYYLVGSWLSNIALMRMNLLKRSMVFYMYLGGMVDVLRMWGSSSGGWMPLEGDESWCRSYGRLGCVKVISTLVAACWRGSIWRYLLKIYLDLKQSYGRHVVIIYGIVGHCGWWCGVKISIFGFCGVLVFLGGTTTYDGGVFNLVSSFVFCTLLLCLFLLFCHCPCPCTCPYICCYCYCFCYCCCCCCCCCCLNLL